MSRKVLIVDDSPANIYLLESLLKGHGMAVRTAENGQEALDKARLDPPDMIVSDILMPVMDGYTLCRNWKTDERLREVPFVFYTANYTEPKDEEFALSLGAERFLVKPQETEALLRALDEVAAKAASSRKPAAPPLGEDMEFFRQHNEILFRKLERKMLDLEVANQKLKIMEEKYRLSFENVRDVIYVIDADLKFSSISPSIEKILGYKPQELIGRSVSEGSDLLGPETYRQAVHDLDLAFKGETIPPTVYQFKAKDGTFRYGEASASPIVREGKTIGLISVVRDITERRKAEERLRQTLQSLNRAVGTTIQVMVAAVEARDPYTSGHQSRVADLACAVAKEMGLPTDRIEAIRLAASIHDLGKISIPAEILSKPARLTDIEISMIRVHSLKGAEILKDVESPWPLAEIVHQHHERMDGSGYPRKLKGEAILVEARILAVADVVEAMASHRPYRPSLGIEAALDEIETRRGTLYDPEVADACLRLFREKGYRLPEA